SSSAPVRSNVNGGKSRPVLSGSRRHVVKSGESLWDISRRYDVTIQQIVEWNHLKDTKVKPGESLLIEK
ncbi:MAG: LysM peptidoglycan-binding domain-containing protein, partial [Fibrobacteraceae bacterium]